VTVPTVVSKDVVMVVVDVYVVVLVVDVGCGFTLMLCSSAPSLHLTGPLSTIACSLTLPGFFHLALAHVDTPLQGWKSRTISLEDEVIDRSSSSAAASAVSFASGDGARVATAATSTMR
jgi:hypothetical protein